MPIAFGSPRCKPHVVTRMLRVMQGSGRLGGPPAPLRMNGGGGSSGGGGGGGAFFGGSGPPSGAGSSRLGGLSNAGSLKPAGSAALLLGGHAAGGGASGGFNSEVSDGGSGSQGVGFDAHPNAAASMSERLAMLSGARIDDMDF